MTQKTAISRRPDLALSGPDPGPADAESVSAERAARLRRVFYWSIVALAIALIITMQPVFAADDTIWTKFTEVMKDIYGKLLGISTILAVTAATIALLVRMISRNQRAVDEATTWLKRIVITWIILNTLGFIIAYLQPWFAGGQYTPPSS
jgi:putative copper export protein